MLTVSEIAKVVGLGLTVAAGESALRNVVTWVNASELEDPTPGAEPGEFLLTHGSSVPDFAASQRTFVRRLAEAGFSGLGFGIGHGHATVPTAIVQEARRLELPLLTVPEDVPLRSVTRAVFDLLAGEQLDAVTRALGVNERLTAAVVAGEGALDLVRILSDELECSVALFDEERRLVGERHAGARQSFEDGLDLPVLAGDTSGTLVFARPGGKFSPYERLVMRQGQNILALQFSLRRAVSAAELRLAGDLLGDLERADLTPAEIERKMVAFHLRPERPHVPLFAVPADGLTGEQLRLSIARELDRRPARYLSSARPHAAEFLVEVRSEDDIFALAEAIVASHEGVRVGIGHPSTGVALTQSILEARAALASTNHPVASYRELGTVELLLSLPPETLDSFVDQVLRDVRRDDGLFETLQVLSETGWRWTEAAERLNVHRHTLRYRVRRVQELTGRDTSAPEERVAFWFAIKARHILDAHAATGAVNGSRALDD